MSKLVITSAGLINRVISRVQNARFWNGSIAETYNFYAVDGGWLAGQACTTETEDRYNGNSVERSELDTHKAEACLSRCAEGTKLRFISRDSDDFERWGWELATRTRDGWVVDTDNLRDFVAHYA